MSKQKHDLGRIKHAQAPEHPAMSRQDRRKGRSKRVADRYAKAEKEFQQLEAARRNAARADSNQTDTTAQPPS